MTSAEKALLFIQSALEHGRTVYVSTMTRVTAISPATAKRWAQAGRVLFGLDDAGNLRLASGKQMNVIATPSIVMVGLTAR
jgi:hypothetical protein